MLDRCRNKYFLKLFEYQTKKSVGSLNVIQSYSEFVCFSVDIILTVCKTGYFQLRITISCLFHLPDIICRSFGFSIKTWPYIQSCDIRWDFAL